MDLTHHELYGIVGNLVQAAREHGKLTQEELAQRIGLTRASVSNIEHGRQKIQLHTLWNIASVLGVSAHELLPPDQKGSLLSADHQLVNDLPPAEREWVKRVVTGRRK